MIKEEMSKLNKAKDLFQSYLDNENMECMSFAKCIEIVELYEQAIEEIQKNCQKTIYEAGFQLGQKHKKEIEELNNVPKRRNS